jgi:hypothetical protein
MPKPDAMIEFVRELSAEQRLEMIKFLWLFSHAPEPAQRAALEQIIPLFGPDPPDEEDIARIVNLVIAGLRSAVDELGVARRF